MIPPRAAGLKHFELFLPVSVFVLVAVGLVGCDPAPKHVRRRSSVLATSTHVYRDVRLEGYSSPTPAISGMSLVVTRAKLVPASAAAAEARKLSGHASSALPASASISTHVAPTSWAGPTPTTEVSTSPEPGSSTEAAKVADSKSLLELPGPSMATDMEAPVGTSGFLNSTRNCYLAAPLQTTGGCEKIADLEDNGSFSLNLFGQDSSAKRICLEEMRKLDGDTFVFQIGKCEVWKCATRPNLRASAFPSPEDIEAAKALAGLPVVLFFSYHNTYLAVDAGDAIKADGLDDGPATRFVLYRKGTNQVSLWHHGTGYVSASEGGILTADREVADTWETFTLENNEDDTVSLKSFHGQYVSALSNGFAIATAPFKDDWEKFRLVNGSTRPTARSSNLDHLQINTNASVYSYHCNYEEPTGGRGAKEIRTPVLVKLWEWNYADIAKECTDYLGPNGFDAVQLSPVVEHKRGTQWWTKYQPISFGLNTRSGTSAEFAQMVAVCREAGVEVMVDLILNHMGTSCGAEETADNPAPCVGWNGSTYGNRRMTGARGWDHAGQDKFRHPPGELGRGVCGVGAPSYLCGSLVTTDCSCCKCDLYGLPDWNTDLQDVFEIHFKHVHELHDMGVTMLRIDAALYEDVGQTSRVLNRFPWDFVMMEWWGEYPTGLHERYIGEYRDVAMAWKVTNALAVEQDLQKLPEMLDFSQGTFGVPNKKALYPLTLHDKRTDDAVQSVATYKNGLEFHQQQKWFMAYPGFERVGFWGGYGWKSLEDGPPGCEGNDELCTPTSVYDSAGDPQCMPTPTESPLPEMAASQRSWICEHRWKGVAGLVGFRKACHEGKITKVDSLEGQLGFQIGTTCLVALVRGYNNKWPQAHGHIGDWSLNGLRTGLPGGHYCDVAQLGNVFDVSSNCDNTVVISDDGTVSRGTVREGDLLAIYTGAKLMNSHGRRLRARPRTS